MSAPPFSVSWMAFDTIIRYKVPFNVAGITQQWVFRAATLAAGFGASAGIFLIFFFDGIPRVQRGKTILTVPVGPRHL